MQEARTPSEASWVSFIYEGSFLVKHSYVCLYKQQGTSESWEHRRLLCCLVLSGEIILTTLSILTFLTIQKINGGNCTFLQYLVFLKNGFIQLLLIFLKEKCEEVETKWP